MGVSPTVAVLKLNKQWDPPGIPSLNVVVLIAGHIHMVFGWGSHGITLENHRRNLLCKVNEDKSDDSAF